MSRNAFDLSEREYNEREDYMANRKEERLKATDKPKEKMTQAQFRVVLVKFMNARARYLDTRTGAAAKAWKAADLELALAYNKYMENRT